MAEIMLTKDNFEETVMSADKPMLVDFYATWCGPCKMMSPVVSQIADELDGQLVVGKLDIDEEDEIAEKFGVMSIPTFMVFKNGEAVDTTVGAIPKEQLLALVKKHL